MPAPLDVDREAIKTLAIASGVRKAARQTGIPESTVKSWCTREGWLKPKPLPPTIAPKALPSTASKPSEALANALANDAGATRIGFSKLARKVAEHGARQGVAGILKRSRAYRDVTAIAAQVHGWDAKQQPASGGFNLNILTGQAAVQVITPVDPP